MTLRLDPQAQCDACGCYGAYRFDTETLCADCYAGRGSCCSSEFNGSPPDHGPETEAPVCRITTPETPERPPVTL